MDSNERSDPRDSVGADPAGEVEADPAASTLIGANVTGINTAPYPGGVVGPAAEIAGEEAQEEEELGAINLDALEQFGSNRTQTGDQGVSANQRELESGELNG